MRAVWLLLLAVSCGSSQQDLRDSSIAERAKEPPAYRMVEKLRQEYRLGRGCGSGPFEIALEVPALPGLTRLSFMSVGARELPLRFEVSSSGSTSFRTFVHNLPPDERCAARAGEVIAAPVAVGDGPGPSRPLAAPAKSRAKAAPAAMPIVKPEPAFVLTATPAAVPPKERSFQQGEMFFTDGVPREIPDLGGRSCWNFLRPPPGPIKVKLWLTSVQHLDDFALHVVLDAVEPIGSAAIFEQRVAARLAADSALAQSRVDFCRENPHNHQCFVGCARGNVKSGIGVSVSPGPLPRPPVEIQPPRPQLDAEWIAGAWRWSGVKYEWDAGFWRLPVAPAVKVVASAPLPPPAPRVVLAPPPAPRIEQAPPPPAAAVLWVPGYWAWNGAAWIWIIGAWQAPPEPAARFVPPRIVIVPGGVTFDPGRWILRTP